LPDDTSGKEFSTIEFFSMVLSFALVESHSQRRTACYSYPGWISGCTSLNVRIGEISNVASTRARRQRWHTDIAAHDAERKRLVTTSHIRRSSPRFQLFSHLKLPESRQSRTQQSADHECRAQVTTNDGSRLQRFNLTTKSTGRISKDACALTAPDDPSPNDQCPMTNDQ
jgi:hypothetical protein